MKLQTEGSVVAFRPGEIGDETDSESDGDGEVDANSDSPHLLFWLGVVVKPFTVAEETGTVGTTTVQEGNPYFVVQWLEIDADNDDGRHLWYKLHGVQDCITGVRIEGILPVRKLGKVNITSARKKETHYKLAVTNKQRILAVST